jgi:hypothetical protein
MVYTILDARLEDYDLINDCSGDAPTTIATTTAITTAGPGNGQRFSEKIFYNRKFTRKNSF